MRMKLLFSAVCFFLALAGIARAETVVVPYTGPGADIPLSVIRRNMMDDPHFLARVAQAEGMTPARFMGQAEGRIMQQVRKYLAEQRNQKQQPDIPSSPK